MYNLFLAICTQRCRNGGRCIAPNQCSCRAGWDGPDCSQGTVFQLELWELCASILLLMLQLCAHHHARMEVAWDQASVNVSLGGLGSVVRKVKSQSYLPVPNHIPWTQLIFFKPQQYALQHVKMEESALTLGTVLVGLTGLDQPANNVYYMSNT